jgi:hypothetical protein
MPSKKQSVILGGIVAGLLSTSYLGLINLLCCLGVVVGGMVAVWHYTDMNKLTIPAGQGAVMGLLAGLIGALISLVLNYILIEMGIRSDQAISQFFLNQFGSNMPPEQYDAMVEQMNADVTLASYLTNGLFAAIISLVFGSIGGAIGAAVFKKGEETNDVV